MPKQAIRYIEVKGYTQPREGGLGTWSFSAVDSSGQQYHKAAGFIGQNISRLEAEYHSVIAALKFLVANNYRKIAIYSGQEVLVKQLRGEWNIKPALQPLYDYTWQLLQKADCWLELVQPATHAQSAAAQARQAYYQARSGALTAQPMFMFSN